MEVEAGSSVSSAMFFSASIRAKIALQGFTRSKQHVVKYCKMNQT